MIARMHEPGERVDVGAFELEDLAILHQQRRQRVPFLGELLQHARIGAGPGGRLLLDGQLELVEEHRPQLRVGVDVELAPRLPVDRLFDAPSLGGETRLE